MEAEWKIYAGAESLGSLSLLNSVLWELSVLKGAWRYVLVVACHAF